MARIHYVKKSRVERTCTTNRAASHVIPVGSPYTHAAPGFRAREIYRCAAHPFRTSELMTGLAAGPQAAQEAFEDRAAEGFEDIDDLSGAWEELKSEAESYRDERQSALDQWENGNSQLEEYLDTAETAVSELEEFEPEEFSDEEPDRDQYEKGEDGDAEFDSDHTDWEEARDNWLTEQTDAALEALGNVEW